MKRHSAPRPPSHPQFGGVMPHLALGADLGPPRSECGVGALLPWAGRLWVVTYLSHTSRTGSGTGLYWIDDRFRLHKHAHSHPGTYTSRYIHYPSNQAFIGPHVIDARNQVRTITPLLEVRLCAYARHLTQPDKLIYALGMEGELFEVDVQSLACTQIADLCQELGIGPRPNASSRVHFKAAHTAAGRLVVVNNTYDEFDWAGNPPGGRLAEFDGQRWTIIERAPFTEVSGRGEFSGTIFATGWDRASAILYAFTKCDQRWTRYRLPKASHTFDHAWQTEWPRLRETEHERLLMDCHGTFYELSPWAYGGRVWGIRPISTHLWVLGDFCSWRGLLVMGADNASPSHGANHLTGEPSSGLWFGKTDDLWQFGQPKGWGGPWWDTPVNAGQPSDPFLMTGYEHKCLHLTHQAERAVTMTISVDFRGDGQFHSYTTLTVPPGGYQHHEFPAEFSAHWVRVTAATDCVATAQFHYT